jgi:RHS repeat-associated protein
LRNRLTSITVPGSGSGTGTWSFDYDVNHHLHSVTKDGQSGLFLVNPKNALSQVLVSIKPSGQRTFYVYGTGLLYEVDTSATGVETPTDPSTRRTYHYDHRGCTLALSAADGRTVTDRFDYASYGQLTYRSPVTASSSSTPFLFNGAYGIATVGPQLLNMRARWYHPGMKRFLNEDPIGFEGGMNWYAFANGDPLMVLDPTGLWGFGVFGGADATASQGIFGVHAEGTVGLGLFSEGGVGAFVSHGESAGPFGIYSPQNPPSARFGPEMSNPSVGAYAGMGIGFFGTNAEYASDLESTTHTLSFNLPAMGPLNLGGIQISFGGDKGIWSIG